MWGRGAHRKCMGRWDNNATATAQAIHFFLIGALCHQPERIAAVGLSRQNNLVKQCGTARAIGVKNSHGGLFIVSYIINMVLKCKDSPHCESSSSLSFQDGITWKLSAGKIINVTHFCCFTWRYPEAQKGGRWKLSLHKWGGLMTHHVRWCFPNLISRQPSFNERTHSNVNTSH